MKKLSVCLLVVFLLTGCAAGSIQDEMVNSRYAYVIGKLNSNGVDSDWTNGTDSISLRGGYGVFKVTPGRYSLDAFYIGGNRYNYTTQKPSFTVEAGKINYVGEIDLNVSYFNATHNMKAAADFIKANYPMLSQNLKSDLVKVELRAVASDAKGVSGWDRFNQ